MDRKPSTALIIAVTVVAVTCIASLTLILITLDSSQIPEGWLALFLGFMSTVVLGIAQLARVESVARQVDDLANGKMDAKIVAGVARVLKNEHIDPDAVPQIEAARARLDGDQP